jgi:hypothetical protein
VIPGKAILAPPWDRGELFVIQSAARKDAARRKTLVALATVGEAGVDGRASAIWLIDFSP